MMMSDSTEQTAYLDERKLLIDSQRELGESFDRILTTLAAGALALSITFIRQIAPHPKHEWTLVSAWSLLGGSLFAILIAHLTSQLGLQRACDIMDERERRRIAQVAPPLECEEGNGWRAATQALNVIAILAFMMGIGFFAGFSAVNLP
jgi:hypothetical protein